MKIILAPFILIVLACQGHAATVNAANLAPGVAGSRILVDSLNNTLTSGYAAIGYFSSFSTTLDFQGASAAELDSDFNILGSSSSSFVDTSFGPSINGIFSVSGSGPTVMSGVGDDFIGKQAYLVLANGSSLATSTEAFIYAAGTNFSADPSTPVTLDLSGSPFTTNGNTSTGSIVLGGGAASGNVFFGTTDLGSISNALQTAVLVPEPSSLLLCSLSVFALLRRKR